MKRSWIAMAVSVGLALVLMGIVVLLAVDRVNGNRALIDRIEREGVERRDQSCTQSEREHLRSVQGLARMYDYLVSLTPKERGEPINKALLAQLTTAEDEAHTDVAPAFCDEPDVGLDEPDPVVPKRPVALKE